MELSPRPPPLPHSPSNDELRPGSRLGRHELLFPVGHGGMATVWAARVIAQRSVSKLVAVKTILPHLASDPDFQKMFLDEARIAAAVLHPNVCDVHELGEQGGVLYTVMEWVNGDSLSQIFRAAPGTKALDPRMAARVISDACAGLHAAHELRDDAGELLDVVHRDVSPHNILLSLEGTVKVADFGVAKARGQLHPATVAGELKGKIFYMAPEHFRGTAFDRRADIFAMGSVLYEMTTGQRPFTGQSEAFVMRAIMDGTYRNPEELLPGCAPELAGIIRQALSPDPRNRFATADLMRRALERWLVESGAVVTSIHVGDLVRQRLGPRLEKRTEQLRAAVRAIGGAGASEPPEPATRAKGHVVPALAEGAAARPSRDAASVDCAVSGPDAPAPKPIHALVRRLAAKPAKVALPLFAVGLVASVVWASLAARPLKNEPSFVSPSGNPMAVLTPPSTSGPFEVPSAVGRPTPSAPPATTPASAARRAAKAVPPRDTRPDGDKPPVARSKDDDIPSFR